MLKKVINHVIQAKRKNKKLDEALKKKRYRQQLKNKIHTPQTSNPRYGTKERKMEGMNTTLYFWRREKNQEVLMCFLGEKYGEKREKKKCPKNGQTTPKPPPPPVFLILVQYGVPGAIYIPWHAL